MEEINSMVGEEIKKMVSEDGKERKTEGTNREKRDPWQGSGKESHAGARICLLLSSAVKVAGSGPVGLPGLPLLGPHSYCASPSRLPFIGS